MCEGTHLTGPQVSRPPEALAVMPAAVNPEAGTGLTWQQRGFLIHLGIAAVNALSLLPSCIQCDDSYLRELRMFAYSVSIKPSCWFVSFSALYIQPGKAGTSRLVIDRLEGGDEA